MSLMTDLPDSAVILADGCSESYDDSGADCILRFEVAGADVATFLRVVAGLPETITYGSYTATRLVPLKHPDVYNAYASGIRGYCPEGSIAYPTPNGGIMWSHQWFDVRFTTPTFAYDGDEPMITVERDTSTEMVSRPGTAYKFPSDGLVLKQPVGVPVLATDYLLRFHRLPNINDDLYDSLAGCVNATEFRGRPPGTWLYLGAQNSGQLTLGGQASYEVGHRLQYREVPWNQIMRPDGTGFEAPVQAGADNGTEGEESTGPGNADNSQRMIHPLGELNLLFQN